MTTFTAKPLVMPAAAAIDPTKHVLYTRGMVLGEDDLNQEFAYLSGHDQWLARDLLGYGTACGLAVAIEGPPTAPQVAVSEGAALSPRGHLIRVTPKQCARLNDWLRAHQRELLQRVASPPADTATLYVVLCYRDCPTDLAPIPGEPCRSEDAAMVNSRLMDDFKLELCFEAPDQREEDAMRDFVQWLSHVPIVNEPGSPPKRQAFESALRAAAQTPSSPLASPVEAASPPAAPVDYLWGSPPASVSIPAGEVCDYLRAAFRIWTTELRPRWRPNWWDATCTCNGTPRDYQRPDVERLLLAALTVPLTGAASPLTPERLVDSTRTIAVNEERRPYVVHLRMLQEWLLCARQSFVVAGGSSPDLPPLAGDVTDQATNNRVRRILGLPVNLGAGTPGHVLTFRTDRWELEAPPAGGGGGGAGAAPSDAQPTPEVVFGQAAAAGAAVEYSRADHTHGTPPDPIPAHRNDPNAHALAGDVTGFVGAGPVTATVVRLQTRPVSNAVPTVNHVLTWNGNLWEPRAAPRPPAGQLLPFVTITRVGNAIFELWFNVDGPDNTRTVEFSLDHVDVFQETPDAPSFLKPVTKQPVPSFVPFPRNTTRVKLEAEADYLRFVFRIQEIKITEGNVSVSVFSLIQKSVVAFLGYDGNDKTITVFKRANIG